MRGWLRAFLDRPPWVRIKQNWIESHEKGGRTAKTDAWFVEPQKDRARQSDLGLGCQGRFRWGGENRQEDLTKPLRGKAGVDSWRGLHGVPERDGEQEGHS